MIKASKNKVFEKVFSIYNKSLLKRHFYRIHVSGENNFLSRDKSRPAIIYCNHSNWWDGMATIYLSQNRWGVDAYFMMDIEQMRKYAFFKRIGAFSVNRTSGREAMESIDYITGILKTTRHVLWIYPQGLMQPNDFRPIKFYSGIARIIEKLDRVTLIPLVMRYEFLMEQRSEIFIRIGNAKAYDNKVNVKELTLELQQTLVTELDLLKEKVIWNLDYREKLCYFRKACSKTRSLNNKITKIVL